ncbi:MAG: hypothetical protein ACYCZR_11870 [Burkholderiales bacterium]
MKIEETVKQAAKDIQAWFDSCTTEEGESEHAEELVCIQSDLCQLYEDITGKSVF